MKERPILFSTEMVKAILEGRKSQTRRIMKPQPEYSSGMEKWVLYPKQHPTVYADLIVANNYCPYGKPGDVLWVRETWGIDYFGSAQFWHFKEGLKVKREDIIYKADDISRDTRFLLDRAWKPSIFMPREACRIILEVTDVRVERLQDISEKDARAEGYSYSDWHRMNEEAAGIGLYSVPSKPINWYLELWESINGKGSWAKNPWVWVIKYKRI